MAAFSRSSHRRCSVRKGVLRNFAKFTGKHLSQGLLFNKAAGLRPATLLKKRLWHRCFPVNFATSKNTYFYRTLPVAASVDLINIIFFFLFEQKPHHCHERNYVIRQ